MPPDGMILNFLPPLLSKSLIFLLMVADKIENILTNA